MRILCVDDDPAELSRTAELCRALRQKPEVAAFADGTAALAYLSGHPARIALLDVVMPGMDGLALARRIRQEHPGTAVIFLTAHAEHAAEAFRLHAAGYILKPADPERLAEEVDYALSILPPERSAPHIRAQTFGGFELLIDGRPVNFPRARAKELLAYLIDRQGRGVTRADIFAALWEDESYDRPRQKYLDVVIRSLRKTLEDCGAGELLELRQGVLRIRPEVLDCDLYRFFDGDVEAINAYRGEYMSPYSWASITEAYVDRYSGEKGGAQ